MTNAWRRDCDEESHSSHACSGRRIQEAICLVDYPTKDFCEPTAFAANLTARSDRSACSSGKSIVGPSFNALFSTKPSASCCKLILRYTSLQYEDRMRTVSPAAEPGVCPAPAGAHDWPPSTERSQLAIALQLPVATVRYLVAVATSGTSNVATHASKNAYGCARALNSLLKFDMVVGFFKPTDSSNDHAV